MHSLPPHHPFSLLPGHLSADHVVPGWPFQGGRVRDLQGRRSDELGPPRLHLANEPRFLRRRDDAHRSCSLRFGSRYHFPAQPTLADCMIVVAGILTN
ncbi:hypothetical protein ACLB2K_019097 [Fragaria x ananassa]